MSENIGIDLRFFGDYIICGIVLTFVYDNIRVLRRVFVHNNFFIAVEDGLFWMVSLYGFYSMLYRLNDGIPRYFAIAGACLGIKIYKKIVKEHFVDCFANLCKQILDIVIHLLKWLFMPIFWLKKKLTDIKKLVMITLCKRVKLRKQATCAGEKTDET